MASSADPQPDQRTGRDGLVLQLARCSSDDVAPAIGGKARGLGRLMAHGFPVPAGFAVTTESYRRHINLAGLSEWIEEQSAGASSAAGDRETSQQIHERLTGAQPPDDVREAIRATYRGLGDDEPVAVRSSATAEDLADASFAGQQETFLWIRGADAVVEAVLACWASLFSPQAIGYRRRFSIPTTDIAMAVVIQRMVPADAAGVLMTLDPANGDDSVIYVESAFGLGEAIVRGEVAGDQYWGPKDGASLRHQIGSKSREWVFDPERGAVTVREVDPGRQDQPSLSTAEARRLVALGTEVERAFGRPMDVEWAVAPGSEGERDIFLLQARPETVWNRADRSGPRADTLQPGSWGDWAGLPAAGIQDDRSQLGRWIDSAVRGILSGQGVASRPDR